MICSCPERLCRSCGELVTRDHAIDHDPNCLHLMRKPSMRCVWCRESMSQEVGSSSRQSARGPFHVDCPCPTHGVYGKCKACGQIVWTVLAYDLRGLSFWVLGRHWAPSRLVLAVEKAFGRVNSWEIERLMRDVYLREMDPEFRRSMILGSDFAEQLWKKSLCPGSHTRPKKLIWSDTKFGKPVPEVTKVLVDEVDE